jgi:integrase
MRVYRPVFKRKSDGATVEMGNWYLEFRTEVGKLIRFPAFPARRKIDEDHSKELGRKVDELLECKRCNRRPDSTLCEYLRRLPDDIRKRLLKAGLIDDERETLISHLEGLRGDDGEMILPGYLQHLQGKRQTERHAQESVGRVRRIIEGCAFVYWADISGSKVEHFLNGLSKRGKESASAISAGTFNHYLQSIKSFCGWMVKVGRASQSPLAYLDKVNTEKDRRHDRRNLSTEELRRLLTTAKQGQDREGIPGDQRAMLYRIAAETGLRAGELRSLTRNSFALEGDSPTVTIKAAYAKGGRTDKLPLLPGTVVELREFLANKFPSAVAFPMPKPWRVVYMLRMIQSRRKYADSRTS